MSDSDSSPSPSPPPPPRTLSMLLPFLLGLARTTTGSNLNQIVVLDHAARTVVVFEGHVLDSLLRDLSEKSGPLPASKASIDAMPRVGVTELGTDCAICLDGFEVAEEAREMPCKHMYHSDCIEKWLNVRGTCPVCRFVMPVDDRRKDGGVGGGDVEEDEDMEGGESGEGRVVVVNLWVNDGEPMDVESGLEHGSEDSDSESQDEIMVEVDGSSTQEQDPSSEDSSSFSFSSFFN
ncbi:E3 ubiquitin-protein ligase RING1-like [Cucumis melo var. makuwa]|uniref:RING-type E3 ubiquitin transferase n=2 Tax=Cucumis melo TaxID=3656 RepID=A0A5A7T7P7_CUCMM|nr:E3 ubiquitin-protein ligase RING1-like [Cucumis melo var. makuwa]TYK15247.1 E3 ubiquitin-protein ligase RING1-like [Cucumis melo var. makuwa]